MGQVTACGKAHPQNRIARLEQRHHHALVRLRTGIGLDVGVFTAVKFLGALAGQLLDLVHELAATIVTAARIAFRVFVGKNRPLRLENRF